MSRSPLPSVDYAATSSRPTYWSLPDAVRAACGEAVHQEVVDAGAPVRSGFTGAYAGLLTLADGRRVFAKAAGPDLPHVVAGLVAEARMLPLLAGLRCASRFAGAAEVPTDDGSWQVLVVESIDGHQPGAPWTAVEADAAVAACLEIAALPPDAARAVTTTRLAPVLGGDDEALAALDGFASATLRWPSELPAPPPEHLETVATLGRRAENALDGDALVHGDVRPDNLLVEDAGSVRVVDWNHATLGAPWVDLVGLWPLMHHHGIDVRRFREVGVLEGVEDDDIDAFLSLLVGFMLCDVDAPPPPGCTPALRSHQLLMAGTSMALLGSRRGW